MKTYYVSRHYDGNIALKIEANSEEEAMAQFEAEEHALGQNPLKFLDCMELQWCDVECEEEQVSQ